MSSWTLMHVMPPDIYHRLGLSGMDLALDAVRIRERLMAEGRWDELTRYEKDYVRAIQEGLDQVDALRRQVLARAEAGADAPVASASAATVTDAGVGSAQASGVTADGESALRAATEGNVSAAGAAGEGSSRAPASLADKLVRQAPKADERAEYLAAARERVAALVPVSDEERERVAEIMRTLEELAGSALGAQDARRIAEGPVAALERDLSEGGAQRASVLATYLALCQSLDERPDPVSYAHVCDEVERLARELTERRARAVVAQKVSAALERSGFSDQGTVVLEGSRQRLLVAEGERECALALSEDGSGSFALTTVTSADARTAGQERRARIEASAKRLCSTKQRRLLEELEAEGLVASVREEDEVNLDSLVFCAELADLVRDEGRAQRAEGTRGTRELRAGGDQ